MPDPRPKYERLEPHPHPLILRPADLAGRLGVSTRHVTNLRNHPDPARRLPAPFKMGRAKFWRISDVQAWIERQAAQSAA